MSALLQGPSMGISVRATSRAIRSQLDMTFDVVPKHMGTVRRVVRENLRWWGVGGEVIGRGRQPAPDEVPAITERLRDATTKLVEITPYLVTPYPIDEIRRVIDMSAEHPEPVGARSHLVRFAMGILTLLDLMGDAAS